MMVEIFLKDTFSSTENQYYKFIKYFEKGWIKRVEL